MTHVFFGSDTARMIIGIFILIIAVSLAILSYKWLTRKIARKIAASPGKFDNFVVDVLRLPFLVLLIWIMASVFTHIMFYDKSYNPVIQHILTILLIITIAWILINGIRVLFYCLEQKIELKKPGNFAARSSLTKLTIFERMISGLVVIITIGVCLMTFDKIRDVGIGLLSSAGIAGIVIGFAAQKSLGSILAGIQIAITQPIKLGDQVVVEGQSGNIEEINITYVVIKLWDQRRLIMPINYFLENPIENWTRNSSNITGSVFLFVDFKMPLEPLRAKLQEILDSNENWDGVTSALDVTDMTDNHVEIRVLVSSADSGSNWDLQVEVREKLINFIRENYPDCFVRTRFKDE